MSQLNWPAEFDRTLKRDREPTCRFRAPLGQTTQELAAEMERMDVDKWRGDIANAHTKSNGLPLHNANPSDPGFVLRWTDDTEQFAVACDVSPELRDNVRTVYLWVHETRMRSQRQVRTGDSEFAAARLPPGEETDFTPTKPAHEVLHIQKDAPADVIKSAARARKAQTHPDNGGNRDAFQRVVAAEEAMLDG